MTETEQLLDAIANFIQLGGGGSATPTSFVFWRSVSAPVKWTSDIDGHIVGFWASQASVVWSRDGRNIGSFTAGEAHRHPAVIGIIENAQAFYQCFYPIAVNDTIWAAPTVNSTDCMMLVSTST